MTNVIYRVRAIPEGRWIVDDSYEDWLEWFGPLDRYEHRSFSSIEILEGVIEILMDTLTNKAAPDILITKVVEDHEEYHAIATRRH